MSIENTFAVFKTKYSLPDSAIDELKAIFDVIIVDFAHKILSDETKIVPKPDTSKTSTTKLSKKLDTSVVKKFSTKIAEEYAAECGVTLEEIPSETGKVTKKEIEKYIKNKSGSKSSETSGKKSVVKEPVDGESSVLSKKEKCGGINKDGNPCSMNATKTPDGSKKCYCFRHAIDWKQYEISSDSDDELEKEDPILHADLNNED